MTPPRADLHVELVPIATLFPNVANPRLNDLAVPHVAASIKRFGFQVPIIAKRSGEVIAGHTRLRAAKELGLEQVPVTYFDGTDLDATAFGIAENRTHEFATWDSPALAKLLDELRTEDALEGVGFSNAEIDKLLEEMKKQHGGFAAGVDDAGPEPPTVNPVSRAGDLWVLGEHRLLCGDSTKAEDIARVLAGNKSELFSFDPPYAIAYTGNDRPIHNGKPSGKDWTHVYREIDIKDLGEFLDAMFTACLPQVVDAAAVYVWHAHIQQPTIARMFEKHGLLLHQILIWAKPSATFGHSYYRWRHEPCAFGWRSGHKPKHGFGQLDSIWEADWDGKARFTTFHPTSKPTRLFEIPMEQHTSPGDVVLEPFNGSGSQIMAAEKLH